MAGIATRKRGPRAVEEARRLYLLTVSSDAAGDEREARLMSAMPELRADRSPDRKAPGNARRLCTDLRIGHLKVMLGDGETEIMLKSPAARSPDELADLVGTLLPAIGGAVTLRQGTTSDPAVIAADLIAGAEATADHVGRLTAPDIRVFWANRVGALAMGALVLYALAMAWGGGWPGWGAAAASALLLAVYGGGMAYPVLRAGGIGRVTNQGEQGRALLLLLSGLVALILAAVLINP
ncbi:MAG: hypothetical protein AAFR52_03265 [Pseudomonadota bacterium]